MGHSREAMKMISRFHDRFWQPPRPYGETVEDRKVSSLVAGGILLAHSSRFQLGVTATQSMVDRFGLFVIIVLGEVVVAVVEGLRLTDDPGQ